MAVQHCAWCNCPDTVHAFDTVLCLHCGLSTSATGHRAVPTSQITEGVTVDDIPVPEPFVSS